MNVRDLQDPRPATWKDWLWPLVLCLVSTALVVLLTAVLNTIASEALGIRLDPLGPTRRMPARTFVVLIAGTDLSLVIVASILLAARPGPIPWRMPVGSLSTGLFALVGVGLMNGLGAWLISRVAEAYTGIPEVSGVASWIAVLVVAGGLAPAAEEFFFREAILVRVLGGLPRAVAVLASSAAFSALHLASGGPVLLATLFGMGLALAWLRLATGSLGPVIVVHALNNLLALALSR